MSDPTISIGITVTSAGAQPTAPATIWSNYIGLVSAVTPGYTVLPAGMIEDLSSTAVYGLALMDSAAIEVINSITPYAANPYLLLEMGQLQGIQQGIGSNTSVYVVFTGTPGYQIPIGFVVGDGTHQYTVQDGGVITTSGSSDPIYCLATVSGTWAVPANTVTTLISSAATGYSLTITNPQPGTPSTGAQTQAEYGAQVIQANRISGQGTQTYLKTLLQAVPGVQPRLISARQLSNGWEVLCGGGDPYNVANAIYTSGIDLSTLMGSALDVTAITNATLGVVTTNLNHGLTTGQSNVYIAGVVGMSGVNGGPYTVTVLTEKTFTFGVNTTGSGSYVSGGIVTPNSRNISANLIDYPDTYTVPFVNPPLQTVAISLNWNTVSPNYVSDSAVQQLGVTALLNYVNAISVGQPMNLQVMQSVFVSAVVSLFANNPALISELAWTVSINSIVTAPTAGTFLIYGDPESYFYTTNSGITITQS